MAVLHAVVPSQGIVHGVDKKVSWSFMIKAGLHPDLLMLPYGFIARKTTTSLDSTPHWLVILGAVDFGPGSDGLPKNILSAIANDTPDDLKIGLEKLPDCVMLVGPGDINDVRAAWESLGHKLVVHGFQGKLRLSE